MEIAHFANIRISRKKNPSFRSEISRRSSFFCFKYCIEGRIVSQKKKRENNCRKLRKKNPLPECLKWSRGDAIAAAADALVKYCTYGTTTVFAQNNPRAPRGNNNLGIFSFLENEERKNGERTNICTRGGGLHQECIHFPAADLNFAYVVETFLV